MSPNHVAPGFRHNCDSELLIYEIEMIQNESAEEGAKVFNVIIKYGEWRTFLGLL